MDFRSFFYALFLSIPTKKKPARIKQEHARRWRKCVQELHWHVQNANSVTITQRRIRRRILTEWKPRNIADSAKRTQCIKRRNNLSCIVFERGFRMSNEEKAPRVKFFDGVKAEFRKVIWPDKDTLLKQSVAVVIVSIGMGVIIALIDVIMQYGINFLTM